MVPEGDGSVPSDGSNRPLDRDVLDGMLTPFILLEPVRDEAGSIIDFLFTEANQAACDYNHTTRDALVGQRVTKLMPNQAKSGLFDQYVSVVETGEPLVLHDFTYGNEFLEGEARRYDIRAIKVGTGLSYSWVDVTERYSAVAELRESERRYRMLVENAADVIYTIDPQGVVTWIAPTVTRALGWSADELVGTVMASLMHPDDLAETARRRQALHEGSDPRDTEDFLIRIRTKSGAYVWASGTGRTMRGPDGSSQGVMVSGQVVQDLVEARQEAERRRAFTQAVMDAMTDPQVLLEPVRDSDGCIVDFVFVAGNTAAQEAVGAAAGVDIVGQRVSALTPAPLFEATFQPFQHVLETGEPLALDGVDAGRVEPDGRRLRVDVRTQRVGDLLSNTWRNVTERYADAEALAESEARYRLLAENASDIVWEASPQGRLEWVSESITRILGWLPEQAIGMDTLELVHPEDRDRAREQRAVAVDGHAGGEFRLRCADGSYRWMAVAVNAVDVAGEVRRVAGLRDVSGEIDARENLAYLAFHDELTGLRNRTWILDMLESDLTTARRDASLLGVLFIDLDNFKVVNDSLGHSAGDQVLHDVAQRISACLRPGDRVGRFGGDEFIVIATEIADPIDVEVIAERVSTAIGEPITVEGHSIVLSTSIGISLSTPDSTPAKLLRDTDAALFRAKGAGRARWQFFDPAMHIDALARLTTEASIREGLAGRQFVVHYQPIVDLESGTVTAHEALVRWQHPADGLLSPAAFLPVAEDSGLIIEMGDQVLEQVCRMLADHPELAGTVSVNVSPVALTRAGWADRFLRIVGEHDVAPDRLIIEITETAALSILDSPSDDLQRLRNLGIGIHVDDFGTGYSSLTLLRDLPVTGLKMDLSFTQKIQTDDAARVLAQGLALLAAGLGLVRIAEGIETHDQARLVRAQGWTRGQGYLFGRPAPEPVFTPLLPATLRAIR
jgi:diguanylate cyclase (GGDEF)-like protein/PAS domain S-box-containing protein